MEALKLRVLIYKRTHRGDPDTEGVFGIHDCMGTIRDRYYDAVIGLGGKAPWKEDKNIAQKVNWIGMDPRKFKCKYSASCVSFEKFCLMEEKGILVQDIAPKLFDYMYVQKNVRSVMSDSLPDNMLQEVQKMLDLIDNCKRYENIEMNTQGKKCKTVKKRSNSCKQ